MGMRKLIAGAASLSVALFFSLATAPADAARLAGKFKKGVYTAPNGLFTAKSPLGDRPFINDGFNAEMGLGSVSFTTDTGKLYGVVFAPNLDPLAATTADKDTATAILRNWFRDAIFPTVFAGPLPGSTILRDEAGEFEGQPAWLAVVYLPGGSALASYDPATGKSTRENSWRGMVIVRHGDHSYALMKELNDNFFFGASEDFKFDPAAPDWNAFVPRLAEFHRGMQFP